MNITCAFCNKIIDSTEINPCDLNILTNWDKSERYQHNQTFWCHFECFKQTLHKEVQQHLVVHLLSNEEE